ncbi:hypothetical protein HG537_0F01650 [Torulaspora globosa]|uniref:KOW domain-containing protein n=1 Tax=Torulaspora globosa TaxID=48254 RepID=A0A7H9HUJ3_9SACH|nr:hypothetical protein HG537_0F01650 [Torulaspora sp. CBS 2947]
MSSGYLHLSKVGARVAARMNNVPKHLQSQMDKRMNESIPAFMRPALPSVKEDEKFQSVKEWKFLPGDRVVITRGEKKGHICVVKQHDSTTNGFILDENGPSMSVPVPKQYWLEGQRTHVLTVPKAVTQQDLRLVADIDDPENPGQIKTVAVREVEFKGTYYDENYKKMMPYRSVVGENELIIPWPKPEAMEDGELGTDPDFAREQTFWVDSIVKNPIPKSALLTVRNPHSKFRRGVLTARDVAKLVAPKMPLSDTKKAFLEEKKQLARMPRPKLTEDDKNAIGQKIYDHLKDSL